MAIESVRLAREGANPVHRPDVSVAFACRTLDWPGDQQEEARDYDGTYVPLDFENYLKPLAEILANAEGEEKPDLVLMELQKEIPEDLQFPDYQLFIDTGLPLWISYRRSVGAIIDVDGGEVLQDGDRFGNAAAVFEQMGAAAVLVNCLPSDNGDGVGPWLRTFTSLPLGAYPNMDTYLRYEWDWSSCPTPDQFLASARHWVDEGLQIIGRCCGARPAHIEALVDGLHLTVAN